MPEEDRYIFKILDFANVEISILAAELKLME
jgi:hypothetical protein